jgi:sugar phosphate isomerase/epimerase
MGGRYLVHGSPKQRSVPPGSSRGEALERARDCFARAAETATRCGVTYCIEPLAKRETDLINTVAEAAHLVDEIGSPGLKTMIDCSAAGQAETQPIDALMEEWMPKGYIAHVQANDPNRRGPGQARCASRQSCDAAADAGPGPLPGHRRRRAVRLRAGRAAPRARSAISRGSCEGLESHG